jgi:hypothetical protein
MLKFLRSLFTSKQTEFADSIPSEFPQYAQQSICLIIESNGQLEDEQILSLFERDGIPPKEAVELLLFLPQAFCRHLLSEIEWPDYYLEYVSEVKSEKRLYADNERYAVILSALQAYVSGEFMKADYHKIAGRSASFHALNQLLLDNPGRKLAEAIVTPETIIY